MASVEIDRLVRLLARLPGLGQRSAQRAALALLKRRDTLMLPLAEALAACAERVRPCAVCGNLDTVEPCAHLPRPASATRGLLCVVADVEDLWALERAGGLQRPLPCAGRHAARAGRHRAGGARRRPPARRVEEQGIAEVILALGATVDGQTTSHYLAERLQPLGCTVTRLGHGVPVGGELTYLDEGTLDAALRARQRVA